jgi:hypothetical protein
MKSNSWMYVVAVVLLLMAACGLGLGGFIFLGSLGGARVGSLHVILIVLGLIFAVAGIFMIVSAVRKTKSDTAQNVTYKVDLPGDVNVEEMKCKSCGGVLTSKDISMVNGAPVVTCPFCNTVYQLTEEPKW